MTTIYLMRHGETEWNRTERMQGQQDCPLNDMGRRQAVRAGERLAALGVRFDAVISSPLCRALETAHIVSGTDMDAIATDPDIMEMGFGPYEGVSFADLPTEMFTFFGDPEHYPAPEGMETIPRLKERTARFLERLRAADPGGTVLVVAHGVALRVLLGHLMDDWVTGWKMPLENCCIYRLTLQEGTYSRPEKVETNPGDTGNNPLSIAEKAQIVLKKIRHLNAGRWPLIVAIDGRCGAGKTTLAAALSRETGCSVIHMDDYFPQPFQRTAERLATPGENVDHERFLAEVLRPLRDGERAFVRPYDCQSQQIGPAEDIPLTPVIIVEGSYSCHPSLWDEYDLRVFLDVDPTTQMDRIRARNGAAKAEEFRSRWIPLEELYFAAEGIAKRCDLYLT